jgi:hypothetical protein
MLARVRCECVASGASGPRVVNETVPVFQPSGRVCSSNNESMVAFVARGRLESVYLLQIARQSRIFQGKPPNALLRSARGEGLVGYAETSSGRLKPRRLASPPAAPLSTVDRDQ